MIRTDGVNDPSESYIKCAKCFFQEIYSMNWNSLSIISTLDLEKLMDYIIIMNEPANNGEPDSKNKKISSISNTFDDSSSNDQDCIDENEDTFAYSQSQLESFILENISKFKNPISQEAQAIEGVEQGEEQNKTTSEEQRIISTLVKVISNRIEQLNLPQLDQAQLKGVNEFNSIIDSICVWTNNFVGELEIHANQFMRLQLCSTQNVSKTQKERNTVVLRHLTIKLTNSDNFLSICQGIPSKTINSITHLTFSLFKLKISNKLVIRVAASISQCIHLRFLDLNLGNNLIDTPTTSSVIQLIAECKALEEFLIDLRSNELDADSSIPGFNLEQNLQRYLFPMLSKLLIQLQFNSVGMNGAKLIYCFLSSCPKLTNLSINLEWNNIYEHSANWIGKAISDLHLLRVLNINLDENGLGMRAKQRFTNQCHHAKKLIQFKFYCYLYN